MPVLKYINYKRKRKYSKKSDFWLPGGTKNKLGDGNIMTEEERRKWLEYMNNKEMNNFNETGEYQFFVDKRS